MINRQKQKGMTAIGWILVLAMLGIVVLLALKIIPIYIDGYNVISSIESLKNDSTVSDKSMSEIRTMIMRRLDINMVYGVTKDDIFITKKKNTYVIEVDYQRRENIVGNLDIAVIFNKKVEVPRK